MKILVVDDEERLRKIVRDFLVNSKYSVVEAKDGEEALEVFYKNHDIELVILDIMMPKIDGYGVLREIRQNSQIPVIMLSAKSEEKDELLGFKYGVDEYITKPFSPRVLVARVQALLKRTSRNEESEIISDGGIVLDKIAHRVLIDDKDIELSFKEFELLAFFMENKGIALSREKILNSVWNYDYYGDARTIDTHVKKLRAKIGDKGDYIKTIWGMGYKFEV
ncbi:MAG: response regulator transcription factor [Lachnospiraceae bacterium]|nr:response regulator transcription factor [Lachnospiraceae bacterium]